MLKRLLRWLLITGASLVVLVALFYAEENWRGKHAWEKYRREREAKGDSFEWSAIVPPPVPDEQNFAATPLFAELFPKPPEHPRLEAVKLPDCSRAAGNWREGRVENLAAWRACFTNDDLLMALSKFDPILREVGEASRRAHCRFPIRYEDNSEALIPHLAHLRNLARVYRLRALAELSNGQSAAAYEDVQTCQRLADAVKSEPSFISFIVRKAVLDIAMQPVWEGLTNHRWSESQLVGLQMALESAKPLRQFAQSLHGERLVIHNLTSEMIKNPSERTKLVVWMAGGSQTDHDLAIVSMLRFGPAGWLYRNGLVVDRFYNETYLPAVDWERCYVSPKRLAMISNNIRAMRVGPCTVLCKLLAPSVINVVKTAAQSQAQVDQAAVGCALERYRLAHGQLPDKLDVLVPQFLRRIPHDVIDGQPLRYHRTTADQFVLYSIGWNETDDGGEIAWTKGQLQQDWDQGDWVWFSQPQPAPSEQK